MGQEQVIADAISQFITAVSLPVIVSFVVFLIGLYLKGLAQRLLARSTARAFFGSAPKPWISEPTALGTEEGQIDDVNIRHIVIELAGGTKKFVPTIQWYNRSWKLLGRQAIIAAEVNKEKYETEFESLNNAIKKQASLDHSIKEIEGENE